MAVETVVLWITAIVGVLTIGGFVLKWAPFFKRFRAWLYQRTPFYRIDQLQEQVQGLEDKVAVTDGNERSTAKFIESLDRLVGSQGKVLERRLEDQAKGLAETNDTLRDLTQRVFDLHLSSEHPDDLTSTDELREQIRALQFQVADLVELVDKHIRGTLDRSPAAERTRRAAKAARERAGVSDWPALPGSA
jgi:hypothetical protein